MASDMRALTLDEEIEREELAFCRLSPMLRKDLMAEASRKVDVRDSAAWSLALVHVLGREGFHRAAASLLYSLVAHGRVEAVPLDRGGPGGKRIRRRKAASGS